jgi:uncharacterized protein (DUF488 family)
MTETIFSIGHSCHTIEAFIRLLKAYSIKAVADVRSQPHSSRFPQFSKQPLAEYLGQEGIRHVYLGRELGARRAEPECFHEGAARYELIATLPAFREGLARLTEGATRMRIALMCAEKDPLTCHRSILIGRRLKASGIDVAHILHDGALERHCEAEQRLMLEEGIFPGQLDMFGGDSDLHSLETAYTRRGEKICFRSAQDNGDETVHDWLHA